MAENHLEQLNSLLRRCGLGFCQEDIEAIDFIVKENQELKKQLKIKHDGFMSSIEEKCELAKENEKLKKQLEEINNFINKANFANIEQLMLDYCAKTEEQKEFIDWLENEIENCKYGEENYADGDDMTYHNENELRKEILSKYKEIIGDKE